MDFAEIADKSRLLLAVSIETYLFADYIFTATGRSKYLLCGGERDRVRVQ